MAKRMHVFFSGRVQGVGFRYSVREAATGFEVTGFVRNLADGRVEMAAEGGTDELEGFLKAIETGELASFIRHKEVQWLPATGEFSTFSITF